MARETEVQVIPKTQKMVLDAYLLNTQHYKVRISQLSLEDTHWGSLTCLPRYSCCILQPQPTQPLGHLFGESHPSAEIQLVYSTASANLTTRTLIWGVLPLCRNAVVYSAAPINWATTRCCFLSYSGHLFQGSLTCLQVDNSIYFESH